MLAAISLRTDAGLFTLVEQLGALEPCHGEEAPDESAATTSGTLTPASLASMRR